MPSGDLALAGKPVVTIMSELHEGNIMLVQHYTVVTSHCCHSIKV